MTKELALTNDVERGIDIGADWAMAFRGGGAVTAITSARMEIRESPLKSAPLVASFYSDGTGTGILTIAPDDHLTITIELPASVTDADEWEFSGRGWYDLFVDCAIGEGTKNLKPFRGPVDINTRVTA